VLQVWLHPVLPGGAAPVATVPQVAETPAAPGPGNAPLARSENPAADVAGSATLREARSPPSEAERVNERRVAGLPAPADAVPTTASANANPADESVLTNMPNLARKPIAKRGAAAVATGANPIPSPIVTGVNSTPAPIAAGRTAERPPAQQQEMPAVFVSGVIRGEGSSSMVIVNDRLVREGDEVAPGVTLEQILSDSLVFNYKGYRFKR
jgi:general secretion pathway protein B